MMIKLDSALWVNPKEVSHVLDDRLDGLVTVHFTSGKKHIVAGPISSIIAKLNGPQAEMEVFYPTELEESKNNVWIRLKCNDCRYEVGHSDGAYATSLIRLHRELHHPETKDNR